MAETYTDYPQAATENAKKALKFREETDNVNNCGTAVGWARANQLAKREPLSLDTVQRMANFKRHQQNKDVPYEEGCGGLMWDAWGGDEGINWAIKTVEKEKQMSKQKEVENFLNINPFETLEKAQPKAQAQEIRVFGDIFDYSVYNLDYYLQEGKEEPLELLINSPGGSVFDGMAMSALIKRYKGETTATGLGFVASIATVVLMAADKVRLNDNAFMIIHNAWTFEAGEAEELRKTADDLEKISDQIANIYVAQIEKNGKLLDGDREKTKKSIKKMMDAETLLTASEALNIGLIDEITKEEPKPITEEQINNLLNVYKGPKTAKFLNKYRAKMENKEENQEQKPTFWDNLKAFFKTNPEKVEETINAVKNEQKQEEADKLTEALNAVKNAGYSVETAEEKTAREDKEAAEVEKYNNLKSDYDNIMNKLKEFEQQFSASSVKNNIEEPATPAKKDKRADAIKRIIANNGLKNKNFNNLK